MLKLIKKMAHHTMNLFKRAFRVLLGVLLALFLVQGFYLIPKTYEFDVGPIMPESTLHFKLIEFTLSTLASSNDTVILDINSPGGSVRMANELVNAVQNSDAHVSMHVHRLAASCAAILMLTGDDLSFDANSTVVFHRAFIEINDTTKLVMPDGKELARFNDLALNRIIPVLSPEEQQHYIAGDDIVLKGQLVGLRIAILQIMNKYPMLPTPMVLKPINVLGI